MDIFFFLRLALSLVACRLSPVAVGGPLAVSARPCPKISSASVQTPGPRPPTARAVLGRYLPPNLNRLLADNWCDELGGCTFEIH